GERVIVDEAGMLDQDTAIALFTVCDTAAATVALVGDRAQLPAVGRGGVLDMAAHIRGRTFDMAEVHRFADRAYAAVTMRMRDGTNPGDVFDQLNETGLIRLHDSDEDARDAIAAEWREGEAITAATNDDARTLNDRIREVRVVRGLVDDTRVVFGNDGLSIGAGDLIQTRHNNSELGVANRQTWTVQHVEADGSLRVREARAGRKRQRTVHLPAEYVTEHTHLSYATTAYGIQGATVTGAHTLLTDTTTAAGVYVGMTRGRASNVLHIAAEDIADARAQFIDAMGRDRADRGLDVASAHAREDVAGLIENGPVTFINNQIETLLRRAEVAEARAALWQQADTALTELTAQETQKRAQAASRGRQTRHAVERVRAEIVVPILADAKAAVAQWRDANAHEQATLQKIADASWLRKRRARTEHENARSHVRDVRERLTRAWGGVPKPTERPTAWVERVTTPVINADPRLAEAEATHQSARNALYNRPERVRAARLAVYVRVFGAEKVMRDQFAFLKANPAQRCADLSQTAGRTRKEADLLRTLAPAEALERIRRAHAAEEEREARRTARQQTTREEFQRQRHTVRGRPTRGL
ncbi:MAG TPA: AAA family ATPase, partial [Microbacteriaceae bacterium]|nr:AAA family ATPase [Microbacteriaceae bacterium]